MSAHLNRTVFAVAAVVLMAHATDAQAQVVYAYRPLAPVAVAPAVVPAPAYVANYLPAGNYAAVTAFSPPVVMAPTEVAVRAAYPPVYTAASPVVVTAGYAPAPVVAAPVAEAIVPVTTYYAPAAVAVPMRRGLFGGYRPVRSATFIAY